MDVYHFFEAVNANKACLSSEVRHELVATLVPRPLRHTVEHFHHALAVEDMGGRLEVERDFAVGKLERGRVCQYCVASLVEDRRSAFITGDLPGPI